MVAWKAVSKQATLEIPGSRFLTISSAMRAGGLCNGARSASGLSRVSMSSETRTLCRKSRPPWTTRWPAALTSGASFRKARRSAGAARPEGASRSRDARTRSRSSRTRNFRLLDPALTTRIRICPSAPILGGLIRLAGTFRVGVIQGHLHGWRGEGPRVDSVRVPRWRPVRRGGRVVRQRSAKPRTAVQFRSPPLQVKGTFSPLTCSFGGLPLLRVVSRRFAVRRGTGAGRVAQPFVFWNPARSGHSSHAQPVADLDRHSGPPSDRRRCSTQGLPCPRLPRRQPPSPARPSPWVGARIVQEHERCLLSTVVGANAHNLVLESG